MPDISVSRDHKNRQIWSSNLIFVPYQRHHVPRYHEWMSNEELQYLTGSEPLTLDGEFEMHDSWCSDPTKCTFIVLDRQLYESLKDVVDVRDREIQSMIGDVNFYIINSIDAIAEIEVMIAVPSKRRCGFGESAVAMMMRFANEMVGIRRFQAKIKYSNVASIHLFKDVFHFNEISHSDVFEEITYDSGDLSENDNQLKQMLNKVCIESYPSNEII